MAAIAATMLAESSPLTLGSFSREVPSRVFESWSTIPSRSGLSFGTTFATSSEECITAHWQWHIRPGRSESRSRRDHVVVLERTLRSAALGAYRGPQG